MKREKKYILLEQMGVLVETVFLKGLLQQITSRGSSKAGEFPTGPYPAKGTLRISAAKSENN